MNHSQEKSNQIRELFLQELQQKQDSLSLKQGEIAEALGVFGTYLSQIKQNKSPHPSLLEKLRALKSRGDHVSEVVIPAHGKSVMELRGFADEMEMIRALVEEEYQRIKRLASSPSSSSHASASPELSTLQAEGVARLAAEALAARLRASDNPASPSGTNDGSKPKSARGKGR